MHLLRSPRLLVVAALILFSGCGPRESLDQRHDDANTPAGKVGQVAHKAAVEADKAGRELGRKMEKAAHDAHEGWKEDARKENAPKEKQKN